VADIGTAAETAFSELSFRPIGLKIRGGSGTDSSDGRLGRRYSGLAQYLTGDN
jgi:hypothetical protein